MITRNPLVEWPDGIGQVRRGRFALLHGQQQPSQEQARVGTAFTAARTQPLVQPRRSAAVPISQSRIAASEAISTSTVKRPVPLEALRSSPSPKCSLFMSRKLSSICIR